MRAFLSNHLCENTFILIILSLIVYSFNIVLNGIFYFNSGRAVLKL